MPDWLLAFVLLFSGSVGAAAPTKPSEYNINVHVSAYQHLDVTIDGRKYELESVLGVRGLLMPGEYKARLLTDEHGQGGYDSRQEYEFQFSDKRTRDFLVVGQSE